MDKATEIQAPPSTGRKLSNGMRSGVALAAMTLVGASVGLWLTYDGKAAAPDTKIVDAGPPPVPPALAFTDLREFASQPSLNVNSGELKRNDTLIDL
ncbi:MAG: hypothetical protein V3V03_00420, partial [Hyphomonadaceae bacterium]